MLSVAVTLSVLVVRFQRRFSWFLYLVLPFLLVCPTAWCEYVLVARADFMSGILRWLATVVHAGHKTMLPVFQARLRGVVHWLYDSSDDFGLDRRYCSWSKVWKTSHSKYFENQTRTLLVRFAKQKALTLKANSLWLWHHNERIYCDATMKECTVTSQRMCTYCDATTKVYTRGHQHGARGHQVPREGHVGRPRGCFENSVKMMGIVTWINIINNNIIKDKLSKLFISEVCIKLVAHSVNRHPRISYRFYKGWWPLVYIVTPQRKK